MSKHTEWHVSKDATPDYAPQYTIYADHPDGRAGERVATVHGPRELAELIAAAPEMLTALTALDQSARRFRGVYVVDGAEILAVARLLARIEGGAK